MPLAAHTFVKASRLIRFLRYKPAVGYLECRSGMGAATGHHPLRSWSHHFLFRRNSEASALGRIVAIQSHIINWVKH